MPFVAYVAQCPFGGFLAALLDELRWSRASLAGVFSIYAFMSATVGSLAVQLTDRLGPRPSYIPEQNRASLQRLLQRQVQATSDDLPSEAR